MKNEYSKSDYDKQIEEYIEEKRKYVNECHNSMRKMVDETMKLLIKNNADLNFKNYYLSLLDKTIDDYEAWLFNKF